MLKFSKLLSVGSFSLSLSFLLIDVTQLSAYVSVPRSQSDTTTRMNEGGDPTHTPGLRDDQRSPQYLDDWWGRNDYYYSLYGIRQTHTVTNPYYNSYYPRPNTEYPRDGNGYNNAPRYYLPGNPR